ncbi:hypothetical protein ACB098_02G123200 [Castanea mollissima]|uniref:Transmembrane protein n=1 Tax=Castanea mollissima TaxID=60419 RepID=A0A8J4QYG1_9ROSI|nr:hypothetical protein CMV_013263 [Castanea mollissima]
MFDFGDELTLESYKIPWLIWIQLLVLFLLIFLLYGFSLLASDRSDNYSSTASPSTSQLVSNETQIGKSIPKHNNASIVTNCLETTQVGENVIKGEIATSTSRRLVRGGEDITERAGSSATHLLHPCHYFRLARVAFLKCLGLDSSSENSCTPEQRKRKEQRFRKES